MASAAQLHSLSKDAESNSKSTIQEDSKMMLHFKPRLHYVEYYGNILTK